MKGYAYSRIKDNWKKIHKKHGLKWEGNMERFVWRGEKDVLTCYFKRMADVTVEAVVMVESVEETEFYFEAMDFWEQAVDVLTVKNPPDWCGFKEEKKGDSPLELFAKWYRKEKYRVSLLEGYGNYYGKPAPEGFLMAAWKDLAERTEEKKKELGISG